MSIPLIERVRQQSQALIKLAQLSGDFSLQNPLIRLRLIQHLGQGFEILLLVLEKAGVAFGTLRQASLALRHAPYPYVYFLISGQGRAGKKLQHFLS